MYGADSHSMDEALLGRCLDGKFVLRELVGRGAAGVVYRADQVALHRVVAVKVLGPVGPEHADLVRRFNDEAFAASRLHHPNVVSIHDYGQTSDGLLYIVMEYLKGRTLRQLLHDEFPIAPSRVVSLLSQVLSALEEAHAAGVVHADLKCDNIVVESLRDGGDLAKVIDFGIARLLSRATAESRPRQSVTLAGDGEQHVGGASPTRRRIATRVTGTPEYMAPEMISGEAPTKSTDIYAAGVVLHELLTGVLPFTGDSVVAVLARHLEEKIGSLSVRFPELTIPRELEEAALRAMAKKPEQRFASAGAFRAAIKAIQVDTSDSAICAVCGARYGGRFKFCSECGVRLSVESNTADKARQEVEREKVEGQRAFERGDASTAIRSLRDAVGMAIRLGDIALIIDCYRALADVLASAGAVDAAVLELEEAVSLVSAGDVTSTTDELWAVLVRLAELYNETGHSREALNAASRALVHARRVSSSHGRQAAQALMTKLYADARALKRGRVSDRARTVDDISARERGDYQIFDEETQPWGKLDEEP